LGDDRSQILLVSIEAFKTTHRLLVEGNAGQARRLNGNAARNTIPETTEPLHLEAMQAVWARFSSFEEAIMKIALGDIDLKSLENISTLSHTMESEMNVASTKYSAMTITTTKTPVHLMLPLPLSGSWAPGTTMQVASLVAIDIINTQQILMPGYEIIGDIFDDGCDADQSNRATLERFALSADWVGVGGTGCTSVCRSLSVIAASLFLPLVSFECSAGDELSNQELYPNFIRLGTRRFEVSHVLEEMIKIFKWTALAILEFDKEQNQADKLTKELREKSDISIVTKSIEDEFSSKVETMRAVKVADTRVLFFIGNEDGYRATICASHVAGIHPGLTWTSDGVKHQAWWTLDDTALLAHSEDCTGIKISEIFQGALSFTGLGRPQSQQVYENTELDCFQGYTAKTLNDYVHLKLGTGYPSEEYNNSVSHPHEEVLNFAIDGICVFALMTKYMMDRGRTIEDLRTPDESVYKRMIHFMKERMKFQGASGTVDIEGNDLPGLLAVWQVSGNMSMLVGSADPLGNVDLSFETGLVNDTWSEAPVVEIIDNKEDFPILAVVIPALAIVLCGIICYAVYSGRNSARDKSFSMQA